MKKLTLLPVFIMIILSSFNYTPDFSKAAPGSGIVSEESAGTDKGTISCLMDGQQKTFTLQQSFFEIRLDPYSKGPTDAIEILDGSSKREGFQFEFKKSGTTKIKTGGGDMNCIINYYNAAGATYTGKDVTVTVTSYNQKQLTGTFSGKLHNINYKVSSDKNPEFIQITNGKFDLHN
ncbi:MAG: hypothetical protein WDM78_15165 [Puia sp.]